MSELPLRFLAWSIDAVLYPFVMIERLAYKIKEEITGDGSSRRG